MQSEPRVIEVLEGPEYARQGIVAELVERPVGISDERFAQSLIDTEGLQSWNGELLSSPPTEDRLGSLAVFASDGREIHVRYRSGDSRHPSRVCRVRFSRGGMSAARWGAYHWCAAAFGLSLPDAPPPIARVLPGRNLSPREAVLAAADAAPAGVPGLFMMRVVATGRRDGRVYLNSEPDYRDQRNLTINIGPAAVEALTRQHGSPPDQFFQGRFVGVRGSARRTRIDFLASGNRQTGLYYYQTHVAVSDAAQITVLRE